LEIQLKHNVKTYLKSCLHIHLEPVLIVVQITEEELLAQESISPEDVLRLNKITENYLCPAEANVFGIDFTR
jgi:hypothetical protein